MTHPTRMCSLSILLLAGAPNFASADELLLSQPTVTDPADVGLGFYSSSHPRPTRNFKHGDDFRLSSDSLLSRVRWWGQSEGRVFDDLRNFDQYTIEVFEGVASGGGPLPGALVWSSTFAPTSLLIAPTGRVASANGAAEHLYEAIIPDLALSGDTDYILAISARSLNLQNDAWQWQDGEFFGGHSAVYSYASRAWSSFQDTDSAFELFGAVVPAPAAGMAILALALPLTTRRDRSLTR